MTSLDLITLRGSKGPDAVIELTHADVLHLCAAKLRNNFLVKLTAMIIRLSNCVPKLHRNLILGN